MRCRAAPNPFWLPSLFLDPVAGGGLLMQLTPLDGGVLQFLLFCQPLVEVRG